MAGNENVYAQLFSGSIFTRSADDIPKFYWLVSCGNHPTAVWYDRHSGGCSGSGATPPKARATRAPPAAGRRAARRENAPWFFPGSRTPRGAVRDGGRERAQSGDEEGRDGAASERRGALSARPPRCREGHRSPPGRDGGRPGSEGERLARAARPARGAGGPSAREVAARARLPPCDTRAGLHEPPAARECGSNGSPITPSLLRVEKRDLRVPLYFFE